MTTTRRLLVGAGLAGSLLVSGGLAGAVTAHAATKEPDPAGVVNALGGNLQPALSAAAADPNGNLVFSPFSVGVALSMAAAGAAGDTLAQMNEVLGITADSHPAIAALVAGIEQGSAGTFSVANSLWTQLGLDVNPAFDALLAGTYGAGLQEADFAGDPLGARDEVNAWVADATAGRIAQLLSPEQVTTITRFILVNAVHLDAEWASPFDPSFTSPEEFTRGDGSTVQTDFMGQTLFAGYSTGAGTQSIVLPYRNGLEMVVVLPADGGLAGFEQALAAAGGDLDAVLGGFAETEVSLDLPIWDIGTHTDLVPQLQALGMTVPFSELADFTNITTDEPLTIAAVVHEANITVDEAGTEAAAATAVIGEVGAAPPDDEPEPQVMDVDHPFFFAVRDSASGAVLFQGHVNDPSAVRG
jgi:serpin B